MGRVIETHQIFETMVGLDDSTHPTGHVILNEYVEPLGMRVLIRKDEGRQKTRGGIVLPDHAEIPTITGRVVEVSVQVQRDSDFPIEKYDKVLFHPKNAIPVDFEQNNVLFVVPVADIVAVFRRTPEPKRSRTADDEALDSASEHDDGESTEE